MLKILLIANYENDRQESMLRFASLLEAELRKAGISVEVIRPQPFFGRLKRGAAGTGKWLGYIDKFLIFPFALLLGKVHCWWGIALCIFATIPMLFTRACFKRRRNFSLATNCSPSARRRANYPCIPRALPGNASNIWFATGWCTQGESRAFRKQPGRI